jgi:hypothetical protein
MARTHWDFRPAGQSGTCLPGASVTIVATTNLSFSLNNWTVLGIATEVSPGQFRFIDAPAPNNPGRFYRLRSP